jgi:hypothetical protein
MSPAQPKATLITKSWDNQRFFRVSSCYVSSFPVGAEIVGVNGLAYPVVKMLSEVSFLKSNYL